MERQFLVILSICLLASCQTTNNGTLNKINDINETLVNSDLKIETLVVIEEPPKDVWEYIINKSLQDSEIVINDQALLFMNNHIKDVENFNENKTPDYHSLFIRYEKRYNLKKSNLILFFEIWNTYNRENIETFFYSKDRQSIEKIVYFSTIPVGGFGIEF